MDRNEQPTNGQETNHRSHRSPDNQLPDHIDDSPVTNPDVQEALSLRYGNNLIMMLPLKSGRVAIFGADRVLYDIIDPIAGLYIEDLREISITLYNRLFYASKLGAQARFYGEPDDKTFKRDTIASRKPTPTKNSKGQVVDIVL